jgi:hypothetical protein
MRVTASETEILFEFYNRLGGAVDRFVPGIEAVARGLRYRPGCLVAISHLASYLWFQQTEVIR